MGVAMVALPTSGGELVELPLFDQPFYVVRPAGHRLARAEAIALAELERDSILYLRG